MIEGWRFPTRIIPGIGECPVVQMVEDYHGGAATGEEYAVSQIGPRNIVLCDFTGRLKRLYPVEGWPTYDGFGNPGRSLINRTDMAALHHLLERYGEIIAGTQMSFWAPSKPAADGDR